MNLPLPRLLPHAPCPASIRHATGFQIDGVSYDNQIRDESLRGLPRERDGGEGGGGNSMSGREEDGLHRNGLPFPNSIGQAHSFKQRKIRKHQSPSFWTEWTTPPTPTKVDKSKQNVPLGEKKKKKVGKGLSQVLDEILTIRWFPAPDFCTWHKDTWITVLLPEGYVGDEPTDSSQMPVVGILVMFSGPFSDTGKSGPE